MSTNAYRTQSDAKLERVSSNWHQRADGAPLYRGVLAWAFWSHSWLAGFLVINIGALLKVVWSFYFGGSSAWSIIPAVTLGALIINGAGIYVYWRLNHR